MAERISDSPCSQLGDTAPTPAMYSVERIASDAGMRPQQVVALAKARGVTVHEGDGAGFIARTDLDAHMPECCAHKQTQPADGEER